MTSYTQKRNQKGLKTAKQRQSIHHMVKDGSVSAWQLQIERDKRARDRAKKQQQS